MKTISWTLFLAIALIFIVASFIYERSRISTRKKLEFHDIYNEWYADSGIDKEVVRELWFEIAEALEEDAGQLRPADVFGKDVGRGLFSSSQLDTLCEYAMKRVSRKNMNIFADVKTVDAYIRTNSTFMRNETTGRPA